MMTLKEALKQTSKRVNCERKFKIKDKELFNANKKLLNLLNLEKLFKQNPDDRRINILRRVLARIKKYLEEQGIEFPVVNWETIMDYLYNNWDKILRVALSLLVLI